MVGTLFDGATIDPLHDDERLGTLLRAVFRCMSDSQWRTLSEIYLSVGRGSEASISARLRDFRKSKFGGHEVERRRRGPAAAGLWEYRLVPVGPQERAFDAPVQSSLPFDSP